MAFGGQGKEGQEAFMTEGELLLLLRERYSAPEYALIAGVRNQTGFSSGRLRVADAVAMSLYPSRGLYFHGFEIKSNRGDWLKELRDPEKANSIGRLCNYWWVVAEADVVKKEELPGKWGWLKPVKGNLQIVKHAHLCSLVDKPDITFIAALLRAATSQLIDTTQIDGAYRRGMEEERKRQETRDKALIDRLEDKIKGLERDIQTFERASGISIRRGDLTKIGRAVTFITNGGLSGLVSPIKHFKGRFLEEADQLGKLLGEIEEGKYHEFT